MILTPSQRKSNNIALLVMLAVLIAIFAAIFFDTPVSAGMGAVQPEEVEGQSIGRTISLDATVVSIIAGTVIPLLVGIATKLNASSSTKAITALVLNIVAATLTQYVVATDGVFEPKTALVYFFMTVTMQVATYYGLWKPVGDGSAPGSNMIPDKGFG